MLCTGVGRNLFQHSVGTPSGKELVGREPIFRLSKLCETSAYSAVKVYGKGRGEKIAESAKRS